MAKGVDKDSELGQVVVNAGLDWGHLRVEGKRRNPWEVGPSQPSLEPWGLAKLADKWFFNCDGFLVLMGIYHKKAQNQESELKADFWVLDKESKG
jgi:hypothetical protein